MSARRRAEVRAGLRAGHDWSRKTILPYGRRLYYDCKVVQWWKKILTVERQTNQQHLANFFREYLWNHRNKLLQTFRTVRGFLHALNLSSQLHIRSSQVTDL